MQEPECVDQADRYNHDSDERTLPCPACGSQAQLTHVQGRPRSHSLPVVLYVPFVHALSPTQPSTDSLSCASSPARAPHTHKSCRSPHPSSNFLVPPHAPNMMNYPHTLSPPCPSFLNPHSPSSCSATPIRRYTSPTICTGELHPSHPPDFSEPSHGHCHCSIHLPAHTPPVSIPHTATGSAHC